MPRSLRSGARWRWLEWEVEFVRRFFADHATEALAVVLGASPERIRAKAFSRGLHKNRDLVSHEAAVRSGRPGHGGKAHRFPKGHVPANKGIRHPKGWAPGRMAETQFKKGTKPGNTMPVGSFRVASDGYLEVKITNDPGPPKVRWRAVHRIVWAFANGPTPAGHVIAFKPGRRTTDLALITLDALELASKRDIMARNTIHNLPDCLKEVCLLSALLTRTIRQAKEQAKGRDA